MKIILPKTLVEIDPNEGPLFFLAGPIRGGGDWQADCCREIEERLPNSYVAAPCRWGETHPLRKFVVEGTSDAFPRQLNWERHYLELAAKKGCIIFWLPCESKTDPHPGPEPYAMDTRGELGEWRGRMMGDRSLLIAVGAEPGFYGLSQIQRNFSQSLGYNFPFPIASTLAETVHAAIVRTGY